LNIILHSELVAKVLPHLPRKMPQRGTTRIEKSDKPAVAFFFCLFSASGAALS
jgi:hypothetical protein